MSYWTECNWCGADLLGRDHAALPVNIKRQCRGRLDREWAEEVRPTLHFCVAPDDRGERDRMGLDETSVEDEPSCLTRALAAINGTEIESPDMGLEWRLVSVGAVVSDRSAGEAMIDEGPLAEPLWGMPAPGAPDWLRPFNRELAEAGLDLDECPGPFNIYTLRDRYRTVGELHRAIEDGTLLDVPRLGRKTFAWMKAQVDAFLAREQRNERRRSRGTS